MKFPSHFSLTITNRCNLKCRMCGQWSENGYMRSQAFAPEMALSDWKRVIDEISGHQVDHLLIRGGEPFLFPDIVGLIEHIAAKGIPLSIDTNGTMLGKFAGEISRIAGLHLTISVDGPEEIHDKVRGVKGCFAMIRDGLKKLDEEERKTGKKISRSANFTISPWSVSGLAEMPDVCRSLGLETISIVPYYFFPEQVGERYGRELRELGASDFSWKGFSHETSGVDKGLFLDQYRKFLSNLGNIQNYPYMPLSEEQYSDWFSDPVTPVGFKNCENIERLIDVQPSGDANFCVDFVDYSMGNVKNSSIQEVWNSERAERFRKFRRQKPLSVCHRCGAKYMSCPYSSYPNAGS